MSVRVNVGEDKVVRRDFYFVDPFQIIVRPELRGRATPPSPDKVVKLAVSLLTHGQQQLVSARKVQDDRLQLVYGYTRVAAARLIREGFNVPEELATEKLNGFVKDEEFKIKVEIVDCNDTEARERNIIENTHRNNTTDLDDAENQRWLRDSQGMSDADIARFYGHKNQGRVLRLKKLLSCCDEVKMAVHEGRLALSVAIDTLDAPQDQIQKILEMATNEEGEIDGPMIREQVREHILADVDNRMQEQSEGEDLQIEIGEDRSLNADVPEPRKIKARNTTEIRKFITKRIPGKDQEWGMDPAIEQFLKVMLAWMQGKRRDDKFEEALQTLLESQPTPDFDQDENIDEGEAKDLSEDSEVA